SARYTCPQEHATHSRLHVWPVGPGRLRHLMARKGRGRRSAYFTASSRLSSRCWTPIGWRSPVYPPRSNLRDDRVLAAPALFAVVSDGCGVDHCGSTAQTARHAIVSISRDRVDSVRCDIG